MAKPCWQDPVGLETINTIVKKISSTTVYEWAAYSLARAHFSYPQWTRHSLLHCNWRWEIGSLFYTLSCAFRVQPTPQVIFH
ncbi:uncharacterized protein LACBIDRAFT_306851 [Laccaria bicolor S238N-H82]|uniref:Predicted protein n=1 Tax=Laccaria bicolor (strain S238N-H82 / ATCC MYA-4686) TaxID=486041 RepID=B0DNV4_LACBS|nr:uncharacterized protein LACBIDRAFT_306851 [Laccaria bicolor S238N-H82]EDR03791.1 predicted protein [Laccaria bicolor S238N-H82]|eukprot:XP_001885644.1 predicted protein [Laccaria bicolor S238N-H82]